MPIQTTPTSTPHKRTPSRFAGPSTIPLLAVAAILAALAALPLAGIQDLAQEHPGPITEDLVEAGIGAEREERAAEAPNRGVLGLVLAALGLMPAWGQAALVAVLARWKTETTKSAAALAVAAGTLDYWPTAVAILLGRLSQRDPIYSEYPVTAKLMAIPWTFVSLTAATIAFAYTERGMIALFGVPITGFSTAALVFTVALLLRAVRHAPLRTGRQKIHAAWVRVRDPEWWPAVVVYLGMIPRWFRLGIRYRFRLVFTAVSPGIPNGGGIAGASKIAILDGFAHAPEGTVLAHAVVQPHKDAEHRVQQAIELLESRPDLGGYPIILKPDPGEQGMGVKLCKHEDDIREYFDRTPDPAIMQKYHPGPKECGLFWVRRTDRLDDDPADPTPAGRITGITAKHFPVVTGDGQRTLRQLIMDHPRYRCQRVVYFTRHLHSLSRVIPEGEDFVLTTAANHAQGAMFTDGHALITPELEAAIDQVSRAYKGANGGPFDYGRFDLRYESDELLMQGKGFAIVECNGCTSEPTHMYDPKNTFSQMFWTIWKQWGTLCRLGEARRQTGVPIMKWIELPAVVWRVSTRKREFAS